MSFIMYFTITNTFCVSWASNVPLNDFTTKSLAQDQIPSRAYLDPFRLPLYLEKVQELLRRAFGKLYDCTIQCDSAKGECTSLVNDQQRFSRKLVDQIRAFKALVNRFASFYLNEAHHPGRSEMVKAQLQSKTLRSVILHGCPSIDKEHEIQLKKMVWTSVHRTV
jgi:hypothetical protein